MHIAKCAVVAIVLVVVAACGGTGGSVTGSSERCSSRGSDGVCEGRLGTLRGTYGHDVEVGEDFSGGELLVEAIVSVEEGSVEVSIADANDDAVSTIVAAGEQEMLSGWADVDAFGEFEVTFAALEEQARGVVYSISWRAL